MSLVKLSLKSLVIAAVLFFAIPSARGQIDAVNNSTSTPIPGVGHNYIGSLNETVNPGVGSVSVRIDVGTPKGRGVTLPFSFAYDSNGVHFPKLSRYASPLWGSNADTLAQGGWSYTVPLLGRNSWSEDTYDNVKNITVYCWYVSDFVFQDPSGGRHSLGIGWNQQATNACNGDGGYDHLCGSLSAGAEYPNGGDGPFSAALRVPTGSCPNPGSADVASADGTVFHFLVNHCGSTRSCSNHTSFVPTYVEDRNGNQLSISYPTGGPYTVTDTLGRTQLSASGFGATGNTVTVSGMSQPYTLTWGSANSNFIVTETPAPASGVCQFPTQVSGTQSVITAITLPNGKQYQFTYDPTYGELSKITYPSGGYVSYVWGLNGQSAYMNLSGNTCSYEDIYDKPAVLHRYVSFDGVNIALQQDFQYSTTWGSFSSAFGNWPWTSKQTTVTTYDCARNNFVCGTAPKSVSIYTYSSTSSGNFPNPFDISEDDGQLQVEQTVVYQDGNSNTLRTVTKGWFGVTELACELQTLDNGQISGAFYTYGSRDVLTDKKEYDYGQITNASICQNGSAAPTGITPARETATTYQSFANTPIYPEGPSIFDRPSSIITKDSTGTRVAETDFSYDQNTVAAVSPAPTQHDETLYGATSTAPRGNATTITKQCFQGATGCTNSVSTYTFDETGQVLTMKDPCGNATCTDMTGTNHTTSFLYTDSFTILSGGQNVSYTPTGNTNAFLTKITDPLGHTRNFTFDFNNSQLTISKDENGLSTSYIYNDSLERLTQTNLPDGGQTTVSYNDVGPSPSVTTTKKINSSQSVTTVTVKDGLSHAKQTQLTSDPQGTVYVDTTFDGFGRVWKQSNPYRSGNDPTTSSGTTTFVFDALGRKINETEPDGSVITTAYCGPSTLVTDPTGHWRRSRTDGLGRLVEVDEPNAIGAIVNSNGCPGAGEPIWITSYTLDGLNNLMQVVQNGSHQRSFTYDSLSRMLTSTNPEVGNITYGYDANSNVASKTDARSITATYSHDVLSRLLGVTYSDGEPSLSYHYDETNCLGLTACQNIGLRTSITDAGGSEAWAYQVDSANSRSIHKEQRTTNNVTKTSTYYLDLAANVTQVVYPTGRVVNYTYDNANRPSTAVDGSNGITYATDFQTAPTGCLSGKVCYTPQGTFYALSIGQTSSFTGLNLTHTYNNRLQPLEFKASSSGGNAVDITYNFVDPSTNKNAGHVYGITNNLDSTRSQTFNYDQLNRLTAAQTTSTYSTSPSHCWGETYGLDAWGNLNSIAGTTNSAYTGCSQESGFSTTADANNHLPVWSYDASGNATNDGVHSYGWNAESQLVSSQGGGTAAVFPTETYAYGGVGGPTFPEETYTSYDGVGVSSALVVFPTETYTYDGDGRRVYKAGINATLYWYGLGGDVLAETDPTGNTTYAEYVFFGGKRVAMLPSSGNPITYYVGDMLGTSRVLTTNTGVVCYDADFYPYGGERSYTNNCNLNRHKFEGMERDYELSGNDYFGARYYSNRNGRWLSADWSAVPAPVPYANLTNPQTLNLYAMVSDDPESFADLDGHEGAQPSPGQTNACNVSGNSSNTCIGELNQVDKDETAQQAATSNAQQQAQNQKPGLTIEIVSGKNPVTGEATAEAGAGFTVKIQSGSNFAPGNLSVTADLHFDADKKVAKGTEVLLGAAAESAQAKVGGQEAAKTVNSLLVDVRPYNQSGSFGGKPQEPGYIRFTTTDSQGNKQTGTLNVNVVSKQVPGGLPLPGSAWVQRLVVPIPKP